MRERSWRVRCRKTSAHTFEACKMSLLLFGDIMLLAAPTIVENRRLPVAREGGPRSPKQRSDDLFDQIEHMRRGCIDRWPVAVMGLKADQIGV